MQNKKDNSLAKIAKSALLIFGGTVIGNILALLTRILLVRNLSQEEYGILSLVIVICTITVTFASFGLKSGIARYVAFYRARKDKARLLGTIVSSLQLFFLGGVLSFSVVFFGANVFTEIFKNSELLFPLKLYSLAIPFLLAILICVSVYRGFERVDLKIIFEDVLQKILLLLGLIILYYIGLTLINAIYVHVLAIAIASICLVAYSGRKFFKFFRKHEPVYMKKKLLLFSLPLLLRIFLSQIMSWSDVLMLGFFMEETTVGIYSAAFPLANYIPLLLVATRFLYVPVMTRLYSLKQYSLLKRNYAILTKWILAGTLPIFMILFLFPSVVLDFLYGADYIVAAPVLSVLAIGFFVHTLLGPNGVTLISTGKTFFLMITSIIAAVLNIILNIILIPKIGILGAAIAFLVSLVITNIAISYKLYTAFKIHPFTRNYIKPILLCAGCILIISFISKYLLIVTWWMLPVLFIIFILVYFVSLILTKSFDKEDIAMLLLLEKKSGINLRFVKKILKKII